MWNWSNRGESGILASRCSFRYPCSVTPETTYPGSSMWATRRSDGLPEPTTTVRLPRLSSWKATQVGAALRMAARTCPSCPATPPTEARARARSRASSIRSANAPDQTGRDSATATIDARRHVEKARCATAVSSPVR